MCWAAIENQTVPTNIGYVPKELITYELCKLAVSKHGNAFDWIEKEQFRTYELYVMAVEQDEYPIHPIPEGFYSRYIQEKSGVEPGPQSVYLDD